MKSKLTCRNIKKFIKKRPILNGIDLQAEQGKIVALLGPNGSGKTTTFSILCGLIKADEGELFLDDIDIKDLPMYKRSRLGIGYLPQEPSVFRGLTVEENIYAVLEIRKLPKDKIRKILDSLLTDKYGTIEISFPFIYNVTFLSLESETGRSAKASVFNISFFMSISY